MAKLGVIAADPYEWPFDGDLATGNTALVIIDMGLVGEGGLLPRIGGWLSRGGLGDHGGDLLLL